MSPSSRTAAIFACAAAPEAFLRTPAYCEPAGGFPRITDHDQASTPHRLAPARPRPDGRAHRRRRRLDREDQAQVEGAPAQIDEPRTGAGGLEEAPPLHAHRGLEEQEQLLGRVRRELAAG